MGLMDSEVVNEFRNGLTEIKDGISRNETKIARLEKENDRLASECNTIRKISAARSNAGSPGNHRPGMLSDEAAGALGAAFIIGIARKGQLEAICPTAHIRDSVLRQACGFAGMETRAALTTTDIPLPTTYGSEMRALIANFGVVRKAMFPYPITAGTSKPPRWGTRPKFSSIAMSAAFPQLSPTITYASLESHKIGGLIDLPREIDDSSIVVMGQFLARYGAVEFARAEDTWGLLADGSATYEQVKGVVQVCQDNGKVVQLGATKTAPSDALLADFRAMRPLCATPVLSTGKYYVNATWEQRLRNLKTIQDPEIYVQNGPGGKPFLDGYEVVWTEVLTPYAVTPAASKFIAVFGDLSFWWMGEHMTPRLDTSREVFFANDQLAVRFIEEIDFDYMDIGAASVLQLADA